MRTLASFIVTSLDGFYEGPNGEFDWFVPDEEFNDFAVRQLDEADTLGFGRATYEHMAAWCRERVFRGRARSAPSEVSVFIDENRERFGVEPICETLGVSASAYYQRAAGERSAREIEDERLLELIRGIHERNYFAYGSWRMWRALRRAGEDTRPRPRGAADAPQRHPGSQAARETLADDPRRPSVADARPTSSTATSRDPSRTSLWCADFTYLRCWEGVVFFSFVIDVHSRRPSKPRSTIQPSPRG